MSNKNHGKKTMNPKFGNDKKRVRNKKEPTTKSNRKNFILFHMRVCCFIIYETINESKQTRETNHYRPMLKNIKERKKERKIGCNNEYVVDYSTLLCN